jgi:hypothetical protein
MVAPLIAAGARAAATSATRAAASTAAKQAATGTARAAAGSATSTVAQTTTAAGRGAAAETTGARGASRGSSQLKESEEMSRRFTRDAEGSSTRSRDLSDQLRQQNQEKRAGEHKDEQMRRKTARAEGTEEPENGEPPYKSKISTLSFASMLIIAALLDTAQILVGLLVLGVVTAIITAIINTLINFAAFIIFFMWYSMKGIDYFGARNMTNTGINMIADFFSAGILPSWTIMVCITYGMEKMQEKGIGAKDLVAGAQRMTQGRKANLGKGK